MVLCIGKGRNWPDRKMKCSYSNILFPEILNLFYFSTHEAFYSFEKGKNILFFSKKEKKFFQESMKKSKMEANFMERNIISVKLTAETLFFIKKTKMNFLFDRAFSENIWVHRSDADFIYKHSNNLFNWELNLKNKVLYKNLKKPIQFYLINKTDKIIYNELAAAEIINFLGIDFCFGKNQSLTISEKDVKKITTILKEKKIILISDRENPIQIFL